MAKVANGMAQQHPGMVQYRGRRAAKIDDFISVGLIVFIVSAFVGLIITKNRRRNFRAQNIQRAENPNSEQKCQTNRTETV